MSLILLSACSNETPESFSKHFFEALATGKTDKAINMFSLDEVKENEMTTARGKLMMVVGGMQSYINQNGGLKSVDIMSVQEYPEYVGVHVRLQFGNGTQKNEILKLTHQDGDWKLKQ